MADPTDDDAPQSFAAFLCTHARGRTEAELSRMLRDLVAAVEDTGKGGSITYTLTIKPQPNAEHAVLVTDRIRASLPELERPASIFFADESFALVRNDPRQLTLTDMENARD